MKTRLIAIAVLVAAALIPSVAYANGALSRAEEACENCRWLDSLVWFEITAESGVRDPAQLVAARTDEPQAR